MINTERVELGNKVFVDERLTGTEKVLRGTILAVEKNSVKVLVNDVQLTCRPERLYPIPLFRDEALKQGFIPRSLNTPTEKRNDLVISIEKGGGEWYLLELAEDNFLTIKHNGTEILGSGKVTSLHHLQNLVTEITDGKIKIEGI